MELIKAGNPAAQSLTIKQESLQANKPASPPEPEMDPLIPATLRIPGNILRRLATAAFHQKAARKSPRTQQEITADALEQWLTKHGY